MAYTTCGELPGVQREGLAWQLSAHAQWWSLLVSEEAMSMYGPTNPSQEDKLDLESSGTCLWGATLRSVEGYPQQLRCRFSRPLIAKAGGARAMSKRAERGMAASRNNAARRGGGPHRWDTL